MPPLSGSDEWGNDNEMSNFELSNAKKPKLSDSSLHRVTPDSGIALHYQSSVSSVGSLSPPIEKASSGVEDPNKGFQGFEESSENEKRPRHMSELGSEVANLSLKKTTASDLPHYTSNNSPTPSPSFQKGTIPLSHAPPMDMRAHQQPPLMHVNTAPMPGVSPGLIHSSPAMVHSPAHNTAFPFNPSTQMGHHPFSHPSPPSHPPAMYHSTYPMGPGSHTSPFSHSIHASNPFSHPPRAAPPYASIPGAYSQSAAQHPFRHHYPQQQAMSRNFHHNPLLMRSDSLHSSSNSLLSNGNENAFNSQGNSSEISSASLTVPNPTPNLPNSVTEQSPAMTMEIETTSADENNKDIIELKEQQQRNEESEQVEETEEQMTVTASNTSNKTTLADNTAEADEEEDTTRVANTRSKSSTSVDEKQQDEREQIHTKRFVKIIITIILLYEFSMESEVSFGPC